MASEEISLDKIGQGETSKKSLCPLIPLVPQRFFQRLIISGELCYISPPNVFPIPLGLENTLCC